MHVKFLRLVPWRACDHCNSLSDEGCNQGSVTLLAVVAMTKKFKYILYFF